MDQRACIGLIRVLHLPKGPVCPYCGSGVCWDIDQFRSVPHWRCSRCQRRFNLLTGTAFEWSQKSLPQWFALIGYLHLGYGVDEAWEAMVAHLGPVVSRRHVIRMCQRIAASPLCRLIATCLDEDDLRGLGVLPAECDPACPAGQAEGSRQGEARARRRGPLADHPPNQAQLVAWQAARITWPDGPPALPKAGPKAARAPNKPRPGGRARRKGGTDRPTLIPKIL